MWNTSILMGIVMNHRDKFNIQLQTATPLNPETVKEMMNNRKFKSQKDRYNKYLYFKSKLGEILLFYMLKDGTNISVYSIFESELDTLSKYRYDCNKGGNMNIPLFIV